ncbi:hypothetical protein B0H16DRAFT_1481515 [Mycena metata]|uniref:CxC2-like cysteine cluster KDZ transposase-associated domain-containing protein n=1 Tax=Mycena metata TaxID=1033252 RepID=A0AAD7GY76_9AGAR|nr:hypothetical protein B0H16DRAFT_1481515 [Mycena metata]
MGRGPRGEGLNLPQPLVVYFWFRCFKSYFPGLLWRTVVAVHLQKRADGDFQERPLQALGLWVQLGHAGAQCPNAITQSVHALAPEGLIGINLNICGCPTAPAMEQQVWEYLAWVKTPGFAALLLTRETWDEFLGTLVA